MRNRRIFGAATIARAARLAVQMANRYRKSSSTSSSAKPGGTMAAGGDETRGRTLWVKKKKSRSQKKSIKKYRRRAFKTSVAAMGSRIRVLNSSDIGFISNQQEGMMCLLGAKAGDSTLYCQGEADLENLVNADPGMNTVASTQMVLLNQRLSTTFTNTSTVTLEVDIYYLTFYKKGNFSNPFELITQCQNDVPSINAAFGPSLTLNNRGVTLFDLGPHLKKWGLYINKMKKVLLAPGAAILDNEFIKKTKAINYRDVIQQNVATVPDFAGSGSVKGIFYVYKPTVQIPETITTGVLLRSTRKYEYKLLTGNQQVDAFVSLAD